MVPAFVHIKAQPLGPHHQLKTAAPVLPGK